MIYFCYFILGFTGLRLLISLINFLTRPHLKYNNLYTSPFVSILIPARNEERTLPRLLDSILDHDYPHLEVLIYNDHSEDGTGKVIDEYNQKDPRIQPIKSAPLPPGWTGKNFACHQLAQQAKGEYLLFLDADVKIRKAFISKAINYVQQHKLKLLSLFPEQVMISTGEKLTIPIMNWILLSLLPLVFIRILKFPSMSAANGQCMLFEAATYKKHRWHEQVKGKIVEDIEIQRMLKKQRIKTATLLGHNDVLCRMYTNYKEGIEGFSKNINEFFGGSVVLMLLYWTIVMSGGVFIFLYLPHIYIWFYLLSVVCIRVFISIASRQDPFINLLFHPLQMWAYTHVVWNCVFSEHKGGIVWKGRLIKQD